jgi:hypothetical protein
MAHHIFGIRHHGPGGARALRAALEELSPDLILVEGPPDAQSVLPLMQREGMRTPVALLVYAPDEPSKAVYYPFTEFSPEWQALSYGLAKNTPARFFDLPQAIQFARDAQRELAEGQDENREAEQIDEPQKQAGRRNAPRAGKIRGMGQDGRPFASSVAPTEDMPDLRVSERADPLAMLAQAAGYADHEVWWEQQIEQRRDVTDLFAGILEAMTELRSSAPPPPEDEALREAHMRQQMRAAEKEGFKKIAVICGAWHGPALLDLGDAKGDTALLKGQPKSAVSATWIPWTNSRLAYRSGYGAGITSPGWYEHLWSYPDQIGTRWVTRAAHLLRESGLDASSASVIEAVRLAEALAAMRDLPMPGMAEMHEAILTVLSNGNDAPMQLIRDKLEIGERMGEVPPETPAVPLQRDLEMHQRKLRLKPSPVLEQIDLDLREDNHRAKSQLLHRLRLLDIEWGKPMQVRGKPSTFHEYWQLQWQIEFAVSLIEKNIWGNTVGAAAAGYVRHLADTVAELPRLTALINPVRLAALPGAMEHLLERVNAQAAITADVRLLMDALPDLAEIARYGDVRGTTAEQIMPVFEALFERVLVGLPGACASLDDDAAREMIGSVNNVQISVEKLNDDAHKAEWFAVLRQLMERAAVHGQVRGRCCRILLEHRVLDAEELHTLARHNLSPVIPADQAAAWVEGVLLGSGSALLPLDGLWLALDSWLGDLAEDIFVALLPLVRRGFSEFASPERQKMGEKVKQLPALRRGETVVAAKNDTAIDHERAKLVLPVLAHILGVEHGDR